MPEDVHVILAVPLAMTCPALIDLRQWSGTGLVRCMMAALRLC